MEEKELKKLRRLEFFYNNGLAVILLSVMLSLRSFLHLGYMNLFLVIFFLIEGILRYSSKEPYSIFYLTPAMRRLKLYEKNKFGQEWWPNYRVHAALYLILAALWSLPTKLSWGHSLDSQLNTGAILVPLLFVLVIINLTRFLRNRKVDCKVAEENSNEDLRLFEIVSGLISGLVIVIFIAAYLYFTG